MTIQLPETLQYGKVVGRFVLAVADLPSDPDALPNAVPAEGTVSFTSLNARTKEVNANPPTTVIRSVISAGIDAQGFLYNPKDPEGEKGIWLVVGAYKVSYTFKSGSITGHDILVLPEHDDLTPLDLIYPLPPGGPILTASQYAELSSRLDGIQVGAATWDSISSKPTSFPPSTHKATHATGGMDALTPADIGAATTGHTHAPPDLSGYVPTSRTVNGKPLSANISLNASDVGAAATSHTQNASTITDLTEAVQDIVGGFVVAGTNVTVTYNDSANTFTINATPGSTSETDPEVVRDVIGGALVAGSGIQITVNDASDTITVASTAVLPTRQVTADTGLTGGGDLSANRSFAVDFTAVATAAQGVKADTALQPATAQAINAKTGAYTLVASDAGKLVTLTLAAAADLTVPANVFTAGQRVDIADRGAARVTVVAGAGMTVHPPPGGSLVMEGQRAYASLVFISATEADLVGLVAAS